MNSSQLKQRTSRNIINKKALKYDMNHKQLFHMCLVMNKFEHVYIEEAPGMRMGRCLYGEVQCIIGNGHMGQPCEQTD